MKQCDELYGVEHQERLDCDLEDVVERIVDGCRERVGEPFSETAARVSWPIKVHVFRRMDVSRYAEAIGMRALEDALEMLDEEHADPDGNSCEPTQAMKDAAKAFGKAIVADYESWACEAVGRIVNVTMEQAKEMMGQ